MKIDLYTKACLTVIAVSLLTLSIQPLIPEANAAGIQRVKVTNFADNYTQLSGMRVYCD